MNKCKKPSRKTASKAGKLLRKKISSKDVKTLAGYTLQAASRRGVGYAEIFPKGSHWVIAYFFHKFFKCHKLLF